jgi:cytochrome c-type biogenesis protein CcmE
MKKIHIILLVFIAFAHVAVKLDKKRPVEYNPTVDANFLSFHAIGLEDSTQTMKVVYRKGEIPNLMISERLVLKGKYQDDHFECKDVQTKCPSKYKEEMGVTEKSVPTASANNPGSTNSATNK